MNKILIYHSVGEEGGSEVGAELYSVSLSRFKEQMEYVAKLGTVPLQSLRVSPLRGQTLQIGGDSPLITFDDGYANNFTLAYPLIKKYEFKAYFFILVPKIGTDGYMSWEQIKEIKDAGMLIGSHGMIHEILTELSDKELDDEIFKSKSILEENLGQKIDYFSIPRGFYNRKIIEKAKQAGYQKVFTSNPKDNDGFLCGRIAVKNNWSLEYFIRVVNKGLSFKDRAEESIKRSSRNILGNKNYDRIRKGILRK
jgi:peptidoglycan/xylan/chitin deacetylase (PgdA/CDA1 family)